MYKGIVFDLDGTLIDSPLCFKSIRKRLDIPENHFILEYLELLPEEERAQKLHILQEIELDAAKQAVPFPGALELLKNLDQAGIYLGIFTRNCRTASQYVIDELGIKIHLLITREDAPPKPDPTGLKRFLDQWNINQNELLYIGDFKFDIECGKKAGVKTALFCQNRSEPNPLDPDYVITCYSEFWSQLAKS